MFYRRKIALSILQVFEREISNTDFQKYLFLFTRKQIKPVYDFVPYQYGCFSFQSYADKRTLTKYGILKDSDSWQKNDTVDYFAQLTKDDQNLLLDLKNQYKSIYGKPLIRKVYNNYPYYAIKSNILNENMTFGEIQNIESYRPKDSLPLLFSIGYEGKSIDYYLNQLVEKNIKLLCDVRKNPLSMKYGFSKKQLQDFLGKLGIEYIHMPELGISSNKRRELKSNKDYQKLFHEYEQTTLSSQKESIIKILDLIRIKKRIAVTCFESDYHYCHRNSVVNAVLLNTKSLFKLSHI